MRKKVDLALATRIVNHGPVVLVSSLYDERIDVTPVAWNMPVSKKPPMIVLEIGRKHFIYECILKTKDFVVNIPPASMAERIVKCGSVSGRDVNKLDLYDIAVEESKEIKSPSIKDAIAVLECTLLEDKYLLEEYNMVVGEVKHAEAEEGSFDEHWLFSDTVKTIHHLGDKTFCVPENKVIDLRQGS